MLSIVIITYNEEVFLPRLLTNILAQNYAGEYEVIVADSKSTDNTKEVAQPFATKFKHFTFYHMKRRGTSLGRNTGASLAKGDVILFLDADVILPKGFLTRAIREFKKRKLDVAGAYSISQTRKVMDRLFYGVLNMYMRLFQRHMPHTPGYCIFCKKKLFDAVGGFDNSIVLCEDSEFIQRAAKKSRFRMLRSSAIFASTRRFEAEGYLRLGIKYALVQIYRTFFGEIRSNIFNYSFEYSKLKKTMRKKKTRA